MKMANRTCCCAWQRQLSTSDRSSRSASSLSLSLAATSSELRVTRMASAVQLNTELSQTAIAIAHPERRARDRDSHSPLVTSLAAAGIQRRDFPHPPNEGASEQTDRHSAPQRFHGENNDRAASAPIVTFPHVDAPGKKGPLYFSQMIPFIINYCCFNFEKLGLSWGRRF